MYPSRSAVLARARTVSCEERASGFARLQRVGKTEDVARDHRTREALGSESGQLLGGDDLLDRRVDALAHQDLAVACGLAQPRGEIGHRADRGVVVTTLE